MQISELDKINNITLNIKNLLKPFIPRNLIINELDGIYSSALMAEMAEIIRYYDIYDNGVDFIVSNPDIIPSKLHFKKIKYLIDKEAKFMFAKSPDFKINPIDINKETKEKADIYQKFIDKVIKDNKVSDNLYKAAKDCFIGKRIAIICNFNEEFGISINFVPSLEFIYDTDEWGRLIKIVCFYNTNTENDKLNQRIRKKKYWLENNKCHVNEAIYDGNGTLLETIIEDEETLFEYIPAVVIINEGLTGDMLGQSDVASIIEYEEYYSRMANADMDSEKGSMNSIKYTIDMSSESTESLSNAPGAFWDLQTDPGSENAGSVGMMENNLNYSNALSSTLERIRNAMHEQLDIPAVSSSDLQGIVTSGKTLKAIYWSLIVNCDTKFLSWNVELEKIIKCLIDGIILYPNIGKLYINEKLPELDYEINIVNQYPLPEDEESEKTIDLSEVYNQTMSKKAYMMKWRNLTSEEADEELKQLALERQILQDSFFDTSNNNQDESQDNPEDNQEATSDLVDLK